MRFDYAESFEQTFSMDVDTFIVPFSGGVDSTYLLSALKTHRPDANIVAVHITWDANNTQNVTRLTAEIGAELRIFDGSENFFRNFLPIALAHNPLYLEKFPISSSLSRPQIASATAEVWKEFPRAGLAHSATHMQNTARRLERAWASLIPTAPICAPYMASNISREAKVRAIARLGFTDMGGVHSVDVTPIARVIENGSLEDPANPLPADGIFEWTRERDLFCEPINITLSFERGQPTALDGTSLSLRELVMQLNELGGRHGIGRSSGLEDTSLGVKNHEIREAPAVTILIYARRTLENMVLSAEENLLKTQIDQRWTVEVAAGGWFDELTQACTAFSRQFDALVSGKVSLKLIRGSISTQAVESPFSLAYKSFDDYYQNLVMESGMALLSGSRDIRARVRSLANATT